MEEFEIEVMEEHWAWNRQLIALNVKSRRKGSPFHALAALQGSELCVRFPRNGSAGEFQEWISKRVGESGHLVDDSLSAHSAEAGLVSCMKTVVWGLKPNTDGRSLFRCC